jgi:glycosyltransferase involved in cell wall biosynthesis
MPNAPLEAQSCGTPVVAYAATGTIDAVEEGVTGLLVPPGDQLALGRAIASLLDNTEQRCAMGQAGPGWVARHFDQSTLWNELTSRYRAWLDPAER